MLVFCALTLFATQTFAKNVTIDVITDANNCPQAVSPDDPCPGSSEDVCFTKGSPNFVTWKYQGSAPDSPDFSIVMKNSGDDSIFANGCHESAKKIKCDISENAPVGSYAYSIESSTGCKLDPKIIINN